MINPRTYGFSKTDAEELLQVIGNGDAEYAEMKPKGGGSRGRWYKLIEDTHPTNGLIQKYAVRVDSPAGENPETIPQLVVPWVLAPALAGHIGWYMADKGKWYFIQGDCPAECPNDGVLTVGTAPIGTAGVAYSHAITGSGLTGGGYSSVGFDGLPPGLTNDEEDISGTPTEAGTFYVVVSATAPNSADAESSCTLTRVLRIVIQEAEE
jgi:hypothetical protein